VYIKVFESPILEKLRTIKMVLHKLFTKCYLKLANTEIFIKK